MRRLARLSFSFVIVLTTIALTSCNNTQAKREAKQKMLIETPHFSFEKHQEIQSTQEWQDTFAYIVHIDNKRGGCMRPQLFRWNMKVGKYVFSRWL